MWHRFVVTLLLSVLCCAVSAAALATLSRSFATDTPITPGSLVSTETTAANTVTPANIDNGQQLIGVVVPLDQSLLAIDAASNKVQVALSGVTNVFVSTLGGTIKTGDQIAVSPINGVGMKAGDGMRTIGIAQTNFGRDSPGATKQELHDKSGATQTVYIAAIPIAIVIGYSANSGNSQGILGQISNLSSALAGHAVSTSQAVLSFLIAIIAIAALVALVYGAIHGSIISIGRNPLSRTSIYRSLAQVVLMALLIMVMATVIVYFILV